jgi:hypothetical protein
MPDKMGDDDDMRPTFAKGNRTTISRLLELRREALKDKEPRLVLRIQGILMSLEGHTTGEISQQLRVHRSTVPSNTGTGMVRKACGRDIVAGGPAV